MLSPKKSKKIVGLDVEAGSVAATELSSNGATAPSGTGVVPLAPGVSREGEVTDAGALSDALRDLFREHKLAKDVRLGIANQRVAVRTLRLPLIEDEDELATAIRFQAQDHIPMPLEQAVLDFQVVHRAGGEGAERQMDVVVVAARRDMLQGLLEALRGAGLRPRGIDLSAFGMIRALAREAAAPDSGSAASYEERVVGSAGEAPAAGGEEELGAVVPAKLYCNLGDVTNLAVARGTTCLFTRISPFGVEGIAQRLAERRELTLEHARQWLVHVGLERPVEAIEGDAETVAAARDVLADGASKLAGELRLSLEFYGAQAGARAVEAVVACGPGTTIEGMVGRLQRELGYAFQVGRPQALAHLDEATAARLTLSYGLALEE